MWSTEPARWFRPTLRRVAPLPTKTSGASTICKIPHKGQYYAGIGPVDDGGTASNESMYISAQKRLSRGVTLLANYTWSHCISDVFDQNPTAAGVNGNTAGNRRAYRNNCVGSDLRQLFVLNMVATTPKFSNRWARLLASDWQIAPIMQIK